MVKNPPETLYSGAKPLAEIPCNPKKINAGATAVQVAVWRRPQHRCYSWIVSVDPKSTRKAGSSNTGHEMRRYPAQTALHEFMERLKIQAQNCAKCKSGPLPTNLTASAGAWQSCTSSPEGNGSDTPIHTCSLYSTCLSLSSCKNRTNICLRICSPERPFETKHA